MSSMKEQDALLANTEAGGGNGNGNGTTAETAVEAAATAAATTTPQQQHRRYQSVDTFGGTRGSDNPTGSKSRSAMMSRHRQHKSSIGELVVNVMEPIGEEFQQTGQLLTSSLVRRLDKLDHGTHTGFFDMSLSRSLSILPEDLSRTDLLRDIVKGEIGMEGEAREEEDVNPLLKTEDTEATAADVSGAGGGTPVIQYVALLGAVTAISSNSTALRLLVGVSPPLKLYWRMTASYVALLPLIVLNALYKLQERRQFYNRKNSAYADTNMSTVTSSSSSSQSSSAQPPKLVTSMNLSEWMTFGAAVICYTVQNLLFYASLDYTTIGNAVIYANSQALLLIIAKAFTGERIHPFEAVGVLIAFAGAVLCSKDSESSGEENNDDENNSEATATVLDDEKNMDATIDDIVMMDTSPPVPPIVGDAMALGAAIVGVGYLTFAKAVRPHMSVTVFMFSVLFCGSFLVLAYIAITDSKSSDTTLQFNMDPYTGAFGWLDVAHEQRLPVVLFLAIVVSMVGTMGFVRAMQYFENVVISVATLMEPLMASLIAYVFQIGLLPGPLGWIGNVLVILGTLGVVYPSMGKGSGDGMH